MLLAECDAGFYGQNAIDPGVYSNIPNGRVARRGLGVTLWCPLCVKAGLPEHRRAMLPIAFANPIDGGPPEEGFVGLDGQMRHKHLWQRTGDTLETLTLSPSINAEGDKHDHGPGWHGWIQNGHVVGGGV